jgi:hypothetical protein
MKTLKHLALWVWVAIYTVFSMVSCVTTETRVTAPDGTVTETKISAPDAGTIRSVADTFIAIAPRQINYDK